ncbi:hypothetical protein MTR67_010910 [Solanum verrucosum]|uniref:Aldehyde dehydrogenase domain-containing protein n=1 Tax=Solanum verrucosum TaxID=315347 RepID=A0AAF0Q8I1_SOLVR|nr:hypothetical protein MTR67_010910 [Solanum verrucosum]
MLRFADLLERHSDELAALETWDNGKPYEQAANEEIPMLIRLFRYYAGWVDKIHGLTAPADSLHHVQTLHEPIGVAGQIIPWNFPLLMFAWKVGPALACGNTVVLKPAEQTPLSALYVSKLFHEVGLPPGVLNVIPGSGSAGADLASHMDVDKIAFTVSTEIDADIDKAVELSHSAVFFNQGQSCCAGSRTFVHERVYDEFVEKTKVRALKRIVGDPFKKGVEQGPQILFFRSHTEQFEKILKYIKSGTLESGGEKLGSKGFYVQPTVFSNVQDNMLIARDEIFGPVQSLLKFKDVEEVIRRANSSHYGLAAAAVADSGFRVQMGFEPRHQPSKVAILPWHHKSVLFSGWHALYLYKYYIYIYIYTYVYIEFPSKFGGGVAPPHPFIDPPPPAGAFTQNIDAANTISRALRVGTVWINCFNIFDAAIPFGGYKMSGHGREKGVYSLSNYLQVKAIVTPLKNPAWL